MLKYTKRKVILMNSIYIISPEPLQATLLKNRIAKYSAEASVQSLLFNDFQPNVLHNPNHAFIFTDEKNVSSDVNTLYLLSFLYIFYRE